MPYLKHHESEKRKIQNRAYYLEKRSDHVRLEQEMDRCLRMKDIDGAKMFLRKLLKLGGIERSKLRSMANEMIHDIAAM